MHPLEVPAIVAVAARSDHEVWVVNARVFGTAGFSSFDFDSQRFTTPHLRNLYQKVGIPENPGFLQGRQLEQFVLAFPTNPRAHHVCAPGSGERLGVDRDSDGLLDGDERDAHRDPADPTSTP